MKSNKNNLYYTSKIRIFHETPSFGPGVAMLLENVRQYGSINAACTHMNMAYSKAWKILKAAEKDLGISLLCRVTGGKGGGSSELTKEGQLFLEKYHDFSQEANKAVEQSFLKYFHDYIPEESFLYKKLQLPENLRLLSIIGGGGKTSTMYQLAKEYASLGKKVLLTTTTHILVPPPNQVPVLLYHPVSSEQLADTFCRFPIVALGAKDKPGKLSGIPFSYFEKALEIADVILCEADGAKMLPIKTPASHEPAIVPGSDGILILAGLSALHKPLKEVCHRKDLAAKLLDCTPSAIVGTDEFVRLIADSQGLMKNLKGQEEKIRIFLNQVDTLEKNEEAEKIKQLLLKQELPHINIGSLQKDFTGFCPQK